MYRDPLTGPLRADRRRRRRRGNVAFDLHVTCQHRWQRRPRLVLVRRDIGVTIEILSSGKVTSAGGRVER